MNVQQFREFYRAMQDGAGWLTDSEIRAQLERPTELTFAEVQQLKAVLAARTS